MLGQILLIDAVGAHQRQRIAPSLGGEDDGIGRDGDATFKHQASQGVGGGVAVETEPAKEGIPRRAREVAPRFEQGFEEILGAFVATVVLSPREVAPQAGEEEFHTPESEGKGGHRPWHVCVGGRPRAKTPPLWRKTALFWGKSRRLFSQRPLPFPRVESSSAQIYTNFVTCRPR